MTANYETKEMVEIIGGIVRASGSFGIRPVDVKRRIDALWPGWQTPSQRTVERHMNNNPKIMKKPDTGGQRRSHCKNEPWVFGYYVCATQPRQSATG